MNETDIEKYKVWLYENRVLVTVAVVAFVLGAWIF